MSEFTEKAMKRVREDIIELSKEYGPFTLKDELLPKIREKFIKNILDSTLYDLEGTRVMDIEETTEDEILAVSTGIEYMRRIEIKDKAKRMIDMIDEMEKL